MIYMYGYVYTTRIFFPCYDVFTDIGTMSVHVYILYMHITVQLSEVGTQFFSTSEFFPVFFIMCEYVHSCILCVDMYAAWLPRVHSAHT